MYFLRLYYIYINLKMKVYEVTVTDKKSLVLYCRRLGEKKSVLDSNIF